jgi:hypothetical protein
LCLAGFSEQIAVLTHDVLSLLQFVNARAAMSTVVEQKMIQCSDMHFSKGLERFIINGCPAKDALIGQCTLYLLQLLWYAAHILIGMDLYVT